MPELEAQMNRLCFWAAAVLVMPHLLGSHRFSAEDVAVVERMAAAVLLKLRKSADLARSETQM